METIDGPKTLEDGWITTPHFTREGKDQFFLRQTGYFATKRVDPNILNEARRINTETQTKAVAKLTNRIKKALSDLFSLAPNS